MFFFHYWTCTPLIQRVFFLHFHLNYWNVRQKYSWKIMSLLARGWTIVWKFQLLRGERLLVCKYSEIWISRVTSASRWLCCNIRRSRCCDGLQEVGFGSRVFAKHSFISLSLLEWASEAKCMTGGFLSVSLQHAFFLPKLHRTCTWALCCKYLFILRLGLSKFGPGAMMNYSGAFETPRDNVFNNLKNNIF